MGLEAFLLSQESTPSGAEQGLDVLEDILVQPPMALTSESPSPVDPRTSIPAADSVPNAKRRGRNLPGGVEARGSDTIRMAHTRANSGFVDPPREPHDASHGLATNSVPFERRSSHVPDGMARAGFALDGIDPRVGDRLLDYLAPVSMPELGPRIPNDLDDVEDVVVAPPTLSTIEPPAATSFASLSRPGRQDLPAMASPYAGSLAGWDGFASSRDDHPRAGSLLGGEPDFDSGSPSGQFESRLMQVAERLERAAQRLASPSLPLGTRPRSFRGRIDD